MAHPTLRLLVNINYYFDWYDMDDEHRVKFAKMKLQRSAKIYRMFVERQRARQNRVPINTWATMEQLMKKSYPHFIETVC